MLKAEDTEIAERLLESFADLNPFSISDETDSIEDQITCAYALLNMKHRQNTFSPADVCGLAFNGFYEIWRGLKKFDLIQTYKKRLFKSENDTITFVLTIINLYFRISDRSDWRSQPIDRLSHPPAPFRMKAILALLIENQKFWYRRENINKCN